MIADEPRGLVHGIGDQALEPKVGFCPRDEEGACGIQAVQAREVDEAAIHYIEGPRLGNEQVEHVYFVELAIGDMQERRDVAAQIEQCVQFHGRFGLAKRRPGKERQTQIDRGRIQRVDRLLEIGPQRFVGIQAARHADQMLSKVGVDPSVALRTGVGKRVSGHAAANAHMVELGGVGSQGFFDVAQALAVGQLREGEHQELIRARERLDLVLPSIALDTPAKRRERQVCHQLHEYQFASVHGYAPKWT